MGTKLLLADDSITIQKVVELILSEEGFDIKAVSDGVEAMDAIREESPDIVLADIEMPKMDGYELCKTLKSDPSFNDIPVILLVPAFEAFDEKKVKEAGADDHITKPFESQELLNKINSVLSLKPASESIAEAAPIEEDLWAFEEVTPLEPSETLSGIEVAEEAFVVPEAEEIREEVPVSAEETVIEAEPFLEEVAEKAVSGVSRSIGTMSKEDLMKAMKEVIGRSIPSAFEIEGIIKNSMLNATSGLKASIDVNLKSALSDVLTAVFKDTIEKIVWEVIPEVSERVIKDVVQGSLIITLRNVIEKVAWETIPDIAETLVKKEIEKIRAE
ncbi:MAG: response regulator [Nitrospirae bacterium]|nr:response regulator [Nitrospirota bacterium]